MEDRRQRKLLGLPEVKILSLITQNVLLTKKKKKKKVLLTDF